MNNKDKFTFITFLIIFIIYNIIGYIFDVDVLKVLTIHKNGFGISFISVIAPVITAYLIYYILRRLEISINK
ncbi:hypothetical protein NSA47_11780 [Irregularibacter muris]|uniref:Uncharacterized protein n=1 Tax=Irregularibacter muris TaxID=1796619 RepID=A0AAE3KZS2_9FIRM|nr:hypothetical protein [Irregularibacter muris]MCR1899655.1 hypothetical protein [Irregularibacter muris]